MRIRWTDPAVATSLRFAITSASTDYISEHGSADTARRVALSIYQDVDILAKFPAVAAQADSQRHENSCSQAYHT